MTTPTQTPDLRDATPQPKPKRTEPTSVFQPGHDIVVTTAFSLIGVALLSLLANSGRNTGKIVIIVMVGFAIGWAIVNSGWLQGYLGKPKPIDPVFKKYTG
jgi:hypothetical protein